MTKSASSEPIPPTPKKTTNTREDDVINKKIEEERERERERDRKEYRENVF